MLEILRPGPLLTVQDQGRFGLRHAGISAAGPMDAPAARLANALIGNDPDCALLEFAQMGGAFRATGPCRIAVTGGRPDITLDGEARPASQGIRLQPGQILRIGTLPDSTWGYIAISGGIGSPPVMGSRATHLRSGLGGIGGAVLPAGLRLPPGGDVQHGPTFRPALPAVSGPVASGPDGIIRVVPGPQADSFSPETLARFLSQSFTVTPQRDRMAMVLSGEPLRARSGHDIISDGTVPGSIQVPGSGQPLVLMAEAQTTGGYPKIATVIGADLPRLAQMPSGASFRFRAVTRDMAESLWLAARAAETRRLNSLTRVIARAAAT